MEAYQERVIEEKQELDKKIEKLVLFINSDKFLSLSREDAALLLDQQIAMTTYSQILKERIARFSPK